MKIKDLKNRIGADRTAYLIFFIFFAFFLLRGICLILAVDDIWWYNIGSLSDMLNIYDPNGRYFTNILTYLMCKSFVPRLFIYTASMSLFLGAFASLLGKSFGKNKWAAMFSAGLIILLSSQLFTQSVYNWISGFTNYVISAVFMLWYISFCNPVFEKREIKAPKTAPVLWLICGISGALCLETVTLYNLIFGAFIIILSFVFLKKVNISNIAFMAGTIIGSVLMFFNRNYSDALADSDNIGLRSFDFDISEWMSKIYLFLTPLYARPYFMLHMIIAVSVIVIYERHSKRSDIKLKYARLCIPVIMLFAAYSFVTENMGELVYMTLAFRTKALEAALAAMYVISLCYMIWGLLGGAKRLRAIIYLVSTLILIAPFIVINPITQRCFFSTCIFWGLLAFELAGEAVGSLKLLEMRQVRNSAAVFLGAFIGFFSYMDITNKYVDVLRVKYIKEQIADDARSIELITLPYDNVCADTLSMIRDLDLGSLTKDGREYNTVELYCMTNDIDLSLEDMKWTYIGMIDYNTSRGK